MERRLSQSAVSIVTSDEQVEGFPRDPSFGTRLREISPGKGTGGFRLVAAVHL
jgi:hypothetical protein